MYKYISILFFALFTYSGLLAQAPDLKPTFAVVEAAITELEVDPKESQGENEGQWSLSIDTFSIWVDVWYVEDQEQAYFQVMTPVIELPKEVKEGFYKKLLEYNDELYQIAFSVFEGWVWLKEIREIENLDKEEALNTLLRVGNYATSYIEELQKIIK